MAKRKLLMAMSGGVDSSAAVKLLLDSGADVSGITFDTGDMPAEEIKDASRVAAHYGIRHEIIGIKEMFDSAVKDYFVSEYVRGRTPNPCVICNREIKFGFLLRLAEERGFDGIATGHYARIIESDGKAALYCALDESKDQSYMLAMVNGKAFERAVFPLGDLTKSEIREIAQKEGLDVSGKKDSQDICFVPDGEYVSFMEKYGGIRPESGKYIDTDGNVLGENKGHICYTIGQRKGLGIALGSPRFVLDKDALKNTVTLGLEDGLFYRRVLTDGFNIITEGEELSGKYMVKLRYTRRFSEAEISKTKDGYLLEFDSPVRAPSPGQFAVLHRKDAHGLRVVGGAVITGRE